MNLSLVCFGLYALIVVLLVLSSTLWRGRNIPSKTMVQYGWAGWQQEKARTSRKWWL